MGLLTSGLLLGGPAPAQAPAEVGEKKVTGFVRHFSIAADPEVDLPTVRQELEVKLRDWGLTLSNCDYLRKLDAELDQEIAERYPTWRADPDLVADKQMLNAQCLPDTDTTLFYVAKVSIDVAEELGHQRRVNVQLLPIGEDAANQPAYYGGYAHRPYVETAPWSDMIARALARALGQFNEPPTVVVEGPRRGRTDQSLRFTARDSWDPDGDPFLIRWGASMAACVGETRRGRPLILPLGGKRCPRGTEPEEAREVPLQAGETSYDRVLVPDVPGVYDIRATPMGGPERVGEAQVRKVRVGPGHPHFFTLSVSGGALPPGFLDDASPGDVVSETGIGYLGRIYSRLDGTVTSDLLLGVSATLFTANPFLLDGRTSPNSVVLSLDAVSRFSGPRHRLGIEFGMRAGLAPSVTTQRRGIPFTTRLARTEAWLGGFYARRNNAFRVDERGRRCEAGACTVASLGLKGSWYVAGDTLRSAITLGPILTVAFNP